MIVTKKKIKLPAIARRLKWGIVGSGTYTEEYFLPILHLVQRSKLVSIYCDDKKNAKELAGKFGTVNYFDEIDNFLHSEIDAIYFSFLDEKNFGYALEAIKAKKNILCGLPITLKSEKFAELTEAASKNQVGLIVNYLHHFHPQIHKAKELIEKNIVGKIISVSASLHLDYSQTDSNPSEKNNGALSDLGSQMIDMLQYFGGDIVEIKSFTDNVVYKNIREDFSSAIVKYKSGGYGSFTVSYNCKKPNNRIEIVGLNGSVTIENLFGRKNFISKLIIDVNGEGRKVFRKRVNTTLLMLRAVQKTFLKNESTLQNSGRYLQTLKLIEEIENKK